ncbi:MAG: hypothetical protein U0350_12455 [Caldilineaceae bacterium]
MVRDPKVGEVIRMHNWHGIVLDVLKSNSGKTVFYVQTARNIFRGKNPEHIEINLASDAIETATLADLEKEVFELKQRQDRELAVLIGKALGNGHES